MKIKKVRELDEANSKEQQTRIRVHERTISLRFLGIILRVLRLEVSAYSVYITNQIQGGGGVNLLVEVMVNSKEEYS